MRSYVVIGMGRFGSRIAETLYENGEEVIIIDSSEALINKMADKVSRAVCADAKDKDALKKLGIADCDCGIVALGTDLAGSVLITMNLKSLGVKKIICKAHDDTHKEILEKLGADMVIIPEREVAEKTARMLSSPNFFEFIELSGEYGIAELSAPRSWIGKSIKELDIRNAFGINIIAIKDGNDTIVSIPADYIIKSGIVFVILGDYDSLEKIKKTE